MPAQSDKISLVSKIVVTFKQSTNIAIIRADLRILLISFDQSAKTRLSDVSKKIIPSDYLAQKTFGADDRKC